MHGWRAENFVVADAVSNIAVVRRSELSGIDSATNFADFELVLFDVIHRKSK